MRTALRAVPSRRTLKASRTKGVQGSGRKMMHSVCDAAKVSDRCYMRPRRPSNREGPLPHNARLALALMPTAQTFLRRAPARR